MDVIERIENGELRVEVINREKVYKDYGAELLRLAKLGKQMQCQCDCVDELYGKCPTLVRAELAESKQMQWVSVAERMPEEGILVLVFTVNQTVETRRLLISPKYKWWEFKTSCFEFDWVTHWMSLPSAPKGEDDK